MRGSDEYCPHCDNHFVLDAKIPKASIQVEGEDARVDSRYAAIAEYLTWELTLVQNDQGRARATGDRALHLRRQGGPEQAGLKHAEGGWNDTIKCTTTTIQAPSRATSHTSRREGGRC
jgi:hypothetical protein